MSYVGKWNHWSSKKPKIAVIKPLEPIGSYFENGIEVKVCPPHDAEDAFSTRIGLPMSVRESRGL